ncbi:putative stealth protein CR2 region 2 [Septoria linicola]|nr:putative stealth protein CR2 region 2 [Septoria linicola]
MTGYRSPAQWSTRAQRRRPLLRWATLFAIAALSGLLFSTFKLARRADSKIKRRTELVQRPLQVHDAHGNGAQDSPPEHLSMQSDLPVVPQTSSDVPASTLQEALQNPNWMDARDTPAFPAFIKYASLVEAADTLPDISYINFEDAVKDDDLEGWEADWIASGTYSTAKWGLLKEPRIDFVYTWVNGSDEAFRDTKHPYELNSTLNDPEGSWLGRHGENRYRDWNELKYSVRSIEKYAPFRNKIQILVNSLYGATAAKGKQIPSWLDESKIGGIFEVLAQEEFFELDKQDCLPSFNSLTIENQLHNTESGVDRLFAMSDDMLLGRPHAASDIYSPLYGPLLAFKTNTYNTLHRPNEADAKRFGEKPWLIYTSWLLNKRFGARKRKGQAHFGHSLSRRLHREAMQSFPRPELQSACSRFRGDFGFQLYSWYATFHYTIERHREVLLWSYLMHRSDQDQDGYLSRQEREQIMLDLEEGLMNEGKSSFRFRNFYHLPETLEAAGLDPPKVNLDILWTSMDGPVTGKDIDCLNFDVNDCLAPGFSANDTSENFKAPVFSTAAILDRVARQQPECGDCLIKILLHRTPKGLEPLMPLKKQQPKEFEVVVKALKRYQYVVNEPDGLFIMVTDAEQVETMLIKRLLTKKKRVGQLCLNDDISTEEEAELEDLRSTINRLFEGLLPQASRFEQST